MSKANYRDPLTLPLREQNAYFSLTTLFRRLVGNGWDLMYLNAFVVGMCRASMEGLLGKEEAIKIDLEWRQDIDWDKLPPNPEKLKLTVECIDIVRQFKMRVEAGEIRSKYTYARCKKVVDELDRLGIPKGAVP